MGISSAELAWMRAAMSADLFPDTCTITPLTYPADEVGGYSESSGTPYTDVACFVQPASATRETREIAARLADEPLWEIHLAHDQVITTSCQVTHDSATYRVVWVDDKTSNRLFRRALMRRVP